MAGEESFGGGGEVEDGTEEVEMLSWRSSK